MLIPQSSNLNGHYTLCFFTGGMSFRCAFCATGQGVFQRNLAACEIVGQLLGSRRELKRRLKNPRTL